MAIKKLPRRYKGESAFQAFAIELYKQPKTKTKKEHIRLVIEFIGRYSC